MLCKYLKDRPSIAKDKGVSNELFAAEMLSLAILENIVSGDDRPGAIENFTKCMSNKDNNYLIKEFAVDMLDSVLTKCNSDKDTTESLMAAIKFGFDNQGNMTLKFLSEDKEFDGAPIEPEEGWDIDSHLNIKA